MRYFNLPRIILLRLCCNDLSFGLYPLKTCSKLFRNEANGCVSASLFDECGAVGLDFLAVHRRDLVTDRNYYDNVFACHKVRLPFIVTILFSPSHSTFAPRFSATKRAGSIVWQFASAVSFVILPRRRGELFRIISARNRSRKDSLFRRGRIPQTLSSFRRSG